jgi:hypothetical protein
MPRPEPDFLHMHFCGKCRSGVTIKIINLCKYVFCFGALGSPQRTGRLADGCA